MVAFKSYVNPVWIYNLLQFIYSRFTENLYPINIRDFNGSLYKLRRKSYRPVHLQIVPQPYGLRLV